jgi:RNase adaptor protein for sRNA GlmZ degradation
MELKMVNLSKYQTIETRKDFFSDYFCIDNLPLRIKASLIPDLAKQTIQLSIFLDSSAINDLIKK